MLNSSVGSSGEDSSACLKGTKPTKREEQQIQQEMLKSEHAVLEIQLKGSFEGTSDITLPYAYETPNCAKIRAGLAPTSEPCFGRLDLMLGCGEAKSFKRWAWEGWPAWGRHSPLNLTERWSWLPHMQAQHMSGKHDLTLLHHRIYQKFTSLENVSITITWLKSMP